MFRRHIKSNQTKPNEIKSNQGWRGPAWRGVGLVDCPTALYSILSSIHFLYCIWPLTVGPLPLLLAVAVAVAVVVLRDGGGGGDGDGDGGFCGSAGSIFSTVTL